MSGYSNTSFEYRKQQNCSSVAIEEDQSLSPLVEESVISSPEPSDGRQVAHLSHLWTHVSRGIERQGVEFKFGFGNEFTHPYNGSGIANPPLELGLKNHDPPPLV